jgi:nucleoside 2-deoxyribosyltransferase
VDDGTAWEIGYFYAKKSAEQKIIGIRTSLTARIANFPMDSTALLFHTSE